MSLWNTLWKIVDKCIYVKANTKRQFNLRSLNARTKSIWFIQIFINLFLDSVYMSQNVLNSENFQIQVKKKVSCCLHMKLLWSSALENILIKIKLSSKAKEKGLNRGLSGLPCIKPTDIVL